MSCPMMGSERPVVQADSTWYSERCVVRPTAIAADLTVPVVRAAVARQARLLRRHARRRPVRPVAARLYERYRRWRFPTAPQLTSPGVADFNDLVTTTSGAIDLTATSGSLTPASTGTVPVSPAASAKLVVQVQPSPAATVGQPFATASQPVIVALDREAP